MTDISDERIQHLGRTPYELLRPDEREELVRGNIAALRAIASLAFEQRPPNFSTAAAASALCIERSADPLAFGAQMAALELHHYLSSTAEQATN